MVFELYDFKVQQCSIKIKKFIILTIAVYIGVKGVSVNN